MSRLPIRLRLALAFTVVMALVLGATGLFLYLRLRSELDNSLNAGLRSSANAVAALVEQADSGLREAGASPLGRRDKTFAQVVGADGTVVDWTPEVGATPVLTGPQLDRAGRGTVVFDRSSPAGDDDPVRVLATPVTAQGRRLVVVTGASREARDDALIGLRTELLVGGPLALLLASLAGYALAAAALRPVESMRSRAAEISASRTGQRLPVSESDDEVRRLGETLNDMLDRLETALARERSFVADASHELRTPLARLKTELELALRQPRSREELEDALRSAADETDRLSQLAEDLLVIARSNRGELPIRRSRLEVDRLLGDVVHRFEGRASAAGRRLEAAGADGLTVEGDGLRLEQALGNLVDNSLRHGAGAIRLAAVERDGRVEAHVTDEGAGFPPAFLPTAFERFTQASDSRGGEGAGLGLAIVEVIARAHGGEARARNQPSGGADVWLDLPRSA